MSQPPSQQARKEKEGNVVRRMTWTAGAAALGLSGLFTTAAATGIPTVFAAGSDSRHANTETDDVYVIRQVHVQAQPIQASTGGVRSAGGTASRTSSGGTAAAAQATTVTSVTTTTKTVTSAPAPAPAAATGGTAPRV